jgi:hypothetical protein
MILTYFEDLRFTDKTTRLGFLPFSTIPIAGRTLNLYIKAGINTKDVVV